jgi:hypothetical protein
VFGTEFVYPLDAYLQAFGRSGIDDVSTILPFGRGRIDFVWESTQEIFEKQHKELKS